jgi:hypothetical protein
VQDNYAVASDVYLVWHPEWRVIKIGVCWHGNDRVAQHGRFGWILIGRLEFESRRRAEKFESAVKSLWKSEGHEPVTDPLPEMLR